MKIITADKDAISRDVLIKGFGYEGDSAFAHWGRGCREVYILHYVLTGEGFFNGKQVRAGEGFFIKRREMHEYHSSEQSPWTYFWVVFDGELAEKIYQKHTREISEGIFEYCDPARVLSLSDKIFSAPDKTDEATMLSYFWKLLSMHKRNEPQSKNKHVSAAKRYMELHLHRPISITDVARAQSIDDRYLYNLFIKHEGISPKKYLTELKMQHARMLLIETDFSVSEIASSTGFDDPLTFSRFFSKNEGISPSEYRGKNTF